MPIALVVSSIVEKGPLWVVSALLHQHPLPEQQVILIELQAPREEGESLRQRLRAEGIRIESMRETLWRLELATHRVARRLVLLLDQLGVSLVHSHTYHPDLVVSLLPKRFIRISTLHNRAMEDFVYNKGVIMGRYMWFRYKHALGRIQHLVGISEATTAYYARRLPKGLFQTIPNGIPLPADWEQDPLCDKSILRKQLGLSVDPSAPMVVAVGVYSPLKNHETLLEALAHLATKDPLWRRASVLFLGSGSQLERYKKMASSLGVHALFLGNVPSVVPYMRAADVYVSASLSEGFGLTVVEAALSRCPMVLSRIPSFEEFAHRLPLLKEFLINPRDIVQCAKKISRAVGVEYPKSDVHSFISYYSAQRMSREYVSLYQKLLTPINSKS